MSKLITNTITNTQNYIDNQIILLSEAIKTEIKNDNKVSKLKVIMVLNKIASIYDDSGNEKIAKQIDSITRKFVNLLNEEK